MSAGTDSISLKQLAQYHEQRMRDKPARRFIYIGLGAVALGAVGWIVIAAATHPADPDGWREVMPLGIVTVLAGLFYLGAGALVRVFQRMQDQGREKSKRDFEKVLAEAAIGQMRRDGQLRADMEERYDDMGHRMARIERVTAMLIPDRALRRGDDLDRSDGGGAEPGDIDAELRGFLAGRMFRDDPPGTGVGPVP